MVLPLEPTVWSSRKSDSWCCWLVALASIVMKVFERLLKNHICSSIPVTLDPLQFAYRPNRSTDDAISQVLHSSLTHIDSKNVNYVRLLFIDYSSAFNTIVPIKLAVKLTDLGLNSSLCDWIKDFLTGRPQVNEWMNDAFIWRFHCVLLYTQSDLQSCGGVSPQPPPVCSIHLDDATAATGQRRQCAHHTPATGGEERES